MGDFDDLIPQGSQGQAAPIEPSGGNNEFADLVPNQEQPKQSAFWDAVDSFNGKVREFANGELQLFAKGLDAVGIDTSNFQAKLAEDTSNFRQAANKASENSPYASAAGNILGSIVNTGVAAAQMGGYGVVNPASSITGRAAQQGLLGAAEGAAEYGTAEERAQKGLLTGALSAGTSGLIDSVGKGIGVLRNSKPMDPSLGPQTLGQVTGNESIQNVESGLSKLPLVGTKGNINTSAQNIKDKATEFLGDQGINITKDGIEDAKMGELATTLKDELYTAVSSAKKKASSEYTKAALIADEENIIIPLNKAGQLADEALNPKLAEEGYESVKVGSDTKEGQLLSELSSLRKVTGSGFEALRQKMGDVIGGTTDPSLKKVYTQIKGSLDEDLSEAAKNYGGNFEKQITHARKFYEETVGPFKSNKVLKSSAKFGTDVDADDLLKKALSNDHPELSKTLMGNLTPKGQETYTKALLLKAADDALTGNSRKFDVSKFNKNLYKLGETLDALPEDTKTTIKGLQKFISDGDHILEAAKQKNIGFGAMAGVTGAGVGVLGGWAPLMAAGGTAKVVSTVLTNPWMVKQLTRLGNGGLSEKASENTIKQVIKKLMIPATSSAVTD